MQAERTVQQQHSIFKVVTVLGILFFISGARAQSNSPQGQTSTLICRPLDHGYRGNSFLYQGESIIGDSACHVEVVKATAPVQVQPQPVAPPQPTAALVPTSPDLSTPHPEPRADGKKRLFVTDEIVNESTFFASQSGNASAHGQVNGAWNKGTGNVNGSYNAQANSSGGAFAYSQKGANPRTVEIQADLYKACPGIVVTNDMSRADYVLVFRRQGGKRSTMFAMGGLTGLAFSAGMKLDGASVFTSDGDMVYATQASTVRHTIKEVCEHLK
ncbi:MAG: hypothetical protein WB987_08240 [Candidatus Acidiferrales bacterium]